MADSDLFIAIDFGTAYSGYAFSCDTKQQQDQIMVSSWNSVAGHKTPKTPTCILFDENQTFVEFGYEALKRYTQTPGNMAKKLYLFENFKKELFKKEIHRDLMLTAKNGAKMKAMKVFSESLKYLKKHVLEIIADHGITASDDTVTWVLTVPAIWCPAAKQFMRESAIEAGLVTQNKPERLIIALEPEAASVYCKQLSRDSFIEECCSEEKLENEPGTQYMVVDCGGGTIDITVHEVIEGGHLKELHTSSGNGIGGETIDRKFISFLKNVFSEEVFVHFEQEHPDQSLKMMNEFLRKNTYDLPVTVTCPSKLQEIASQKQTLEKYFYSVEGAEYRGGEIIIEKKQLEIFFKDIISATEKRIQKVRSKFEGQIYYILLVGGYAECTFFRDFLIKKFEHAILCPRKAQEVILRGAVLYGKKPTVINSRISSLTYGISTCQKFNESTHKGKSKFVNSLGQEYCDVCFFKLVGKGESVLCDEPQTFTFHPTHTQQKAMTFKFYSTQTQDVMFVDEQSLKQIGSLTVGMPKTDRDMNRDVSLQIKFGSTEMQATATDVDSKETNSKIEFMNTP